MLNMDLESAIAVNGSATETASQGGGVSPATPSLPSIVTTSWDDGDPLDLEVARMLADRALPGTFYVPIRGHHPYARMNRAGLLSLDSRGFEIGAHGVSHPNLPQCDTEQLAREVETCKKRLEDDLGKEVSMFAYPNGRHNTKVIVAVKRAGYIGARTTAMLARGLNFDPYRMPTSVQAFPHSQFQYFKNFLTSSNFKSSWGRLAPLPRARNWVELAMLLFDTVVSKGGVWHLYGHSWEINDFKLWEELRVVMDYVANRPGVLYLPNSEVVRLAGTPAMRNVVSIQQPA